jgi:hypothetical protein
MTQIASRTKRKMPGGYRISVGKRKRKTVTFGSVTVEVMPSTMAEVRHNVQVGQVVMGKLLNRIQKPGVILSLGKDVPVFYADPKDPKYLIRKVAGRRERVRFEKGDFVVCK